MANVACIRFAAQTKLLDMESVLNQKRTFESIYELINRCIANVNASGPAQHPQLFKTCSAEIWRLADKGNKFAKDRMKYEVNHAYFLRVSSYSLHYLEMAEMIVKSGDIVSAIKAVNKSFAKR